MEWIGTGFVLTIGGVRLRLRIALEDTPDPRSNRRNAVEPAREAGPAPQARPAQRADASSMN